MPLIKIDYNEKILDSATMDDLVQLLLHETMRIFNYGEDKVSIFSAPYGQHAFSTAAAEVEVRAKKAEYDKPNTDANELRQQHMKEYENILAKFVKAHALPKGTVFTITFEDWEVVWLAPEK